MQFYIIFFYIEMNKAESILLIQAIHYKKVSLNSLHSFMVYCNSITN